MQSCPPKGPVIQMNNICMGGSKLNPRSDIGLHIDEGQPLFEQLNRSGSWMLLDVVSPKALVVGGVLWKM